MRAALLALCVQAVFARGACCALGDGVSSGRACHTCGIASAGVSAVLLGAPAVLSASAAASTLPAALYLSRRPCRAARVPHACCAVCAMPCRLRHAVPSAACRAARAAPPGRLRHTASSALRRSRCVFPPCSWTVLAVCWVMLCRLGAQCRACGVVSAGVSAVLLAAPAVPLASAAASTLPVALYLPRRVCLAYAAPPAPRRPDVFACRVAHAAPRVCLTHAAPSRHAVPSAPCRAARANCAMLRCSRRPRHAALRRLRCVFPPCSWTVLAVCWSVCAGRVGGVVAAGVSAGLPAGPVVGACARWGVRRVGGAFVACACLVVCGGGVGIGRGRACFFGRPRKWIMVDSGRGGSGHVCV